MPRHAAVLIKTQAMKQSSSPSAIRQQASLALVLVLALIVAAKIWIIPLFFPEPDTTTIVSSAEAVKETTAFEQQRLRDSSQRVAQWAAERAERAQRRAERERAYQAQRAEWDAEKAERAALRAERQARYDSIMRGRPQKLAKGAHIDANTADTSAWQRVPGVGRAYAQAIVRYRQRLGGFVSAQQLHDITGLPYDIDRWVSVAPHPSLRRIAINRASFKELLTHPYLNYEQVKVIMQHRQRVGNLRSWEDLRGDAHFSSQELERLQPYFSF